MIIKFDSFLNEKFRIQDMTLQDFAKRWEKLVKGGYITFKNHGKILKTDDVLNGKYSHDDVTMITIDRFDDNNNIIEPYLDANDIKLPRAHATKMGYKHMGFGTFWK